MHLVLHAPSSSQERSRTNEICIHGVVEACCSSSSCLLRRQKVCSACSEPVCFPRFHFLVGSALVPITEFETGQNDLVIAQSLHANRFCRMERCHSHSKGREAGLQYSNLTTPPRCSLFHLSELRSYLACMPKMWRTLTCSGSLLIASATVGVIRSFRPMPVGSAVGIS